MLLSSYMLLGCTRYTEYKKRCDALVLRLLIKPILATWDISHPSVRRTAAEELHFKNLDFQDKKRQLTVLKLHRPTADNYCLLEHPTPRSDWISKEMSCDTKHKIKCGLERAQTAKSLRWGAECLIRLSTSDLWFQMNLWTASQSENTPLIAADSGIREEIHW